MAFNLTAQLNAQTNPANLNKVTKDIQKSLDKVSLNLDAKNIAKAQNEVKKLQGSLTKAKSVAAEFGEAVSLKAVNFAAYTLASTAVLKLTGAVSNATRESLKLQVELAKIAQVTNSSNKEIINQSKLLKQVSVEYNIAASKVAQLTRTLAQTGLSFQQAAKAAEVLARTSLLATFDSLQSTTEGFIATLSSFSLSVDQAAVSLEAINAVSKRFAVESSDIVEAIRRTGGAFNAAGGNINELIALFTAVRSTSRESAETIATGFRTIFGRLQRPKTIEFFKELGIQLETAEGQFVGPLQAIQNISRGLDRLNISAGSTQFAEVVEQIGGIRQLSRVVPLLTQTTKITEALGVANNGTAESAEDVAKAQQTLAFQIGQLQKNFSAFIDDVVSSPSFQLLSKAIIGIANALVEVGRALTPLIPLFTVLATLKLSSGLTSLIGGKGGGGGGGLKGLLGFNAGGFVPGSGNSDTVPAMLTPGEFVIRKSAAQAFGAENLQAINKYADGGTAANVAGRKQASIQDRILKKQTRDDLRSGKAFNAQDTFKQNIRTEKVDYPASIVKGGVINPILFEREALASKNAANLGANAPVDGISGNNRLFEVKAGGFKNSDIVGKSVAYELTNFGKIKGKTTSGIDSGIDTRQVTVLTPGKAIEDRNQVAKDAVSERRIGAGKKKKFATGGMASGTDTVPALLTPGEFVVNKKSAQAFGYGNLKEVNKYAKGGVVQKFQFGGVVGGLGGGLGGGGLLSGIGDELLGIGSSFAALQVSTAAYSGILEEGVKPIKAFIDSIKEGKVAREEANAALEESKAKQIQAAAELEEAVSSLEISKAGFQQFDPSQVQGDIDATLPGLPDASPLQGGDLAKAQSELKNRYKAIAKEYGNDVQVTKALGKIKSQLRGSTKKQNAALDALTDRLSDSTKAAEVRVQAAKENLKAVKEETEARKKAADEINKGGGLFGKLKGKASIEGLAKAADLAANVGIAVFVNQLNKASDAAQKLSDKAIEAGNVEEAKAQASEAAAKRAQAAAQVQASAALSGVGSAIGSIFGPIGTLVGGVIGKLLSLLPGVTEAFAELTDWLGITNYEEERRAAAIKAANAALKTWTNDLEESGKKLIEEAKLRGESAEKISGIIASQAAQQAAKQSTRSIGEREEGKLSIEDLANIDDFRKQFRQQAQTSGAGDVAGVLKSSKNLQIAFNEFKKTLESDFEVEELDKFKEELANVAKTAAVQRQKFDEVNNELQLLRLSAGETVSALDILGKSVSQEVADDLKRLEPLIDARIKVQQQLIKSELKRIDTVDKFAERIREVTNSKIVSPDQRENRRQLDRQRLKALTKNFGPNAPTNLNQVNAALSASGQGLLGFADRLKELQKSGATAKQLSDLGGKFKQAQVNTENLKKAQDVLLNGIKFQEEAIRKETKARLEAIAALDDFKGGLVEEFAFGTDEDRRELGRSAAVTAQAIQQGGLQNIASEDRGRVKSFLDRLPQDVAIQQFGGKTAGRLKGEFAADEAIRAGLIGANQREEFIQKVEQQGKPIEERVGKAFEDGTKQIIASILREETAEKANLEAQKAYTKQFADAVEKFRKQAENPAAEQLKPGEREELAKNLANLQAEKQGLESGDDAKLLKRLLKQRAKLEEEVKLRTRTVEANKEAGKEIVLSDKGRGQVSGFSLLNPFNTEKDLVASLLKDKGITQEQAIKQGLIGRAEDVNPSIGNTNFLELRRRKENRLASSQGTLEEINSQIDTVQKRRDVEIPDINRRIQEIQARLQLEDAPGPAQGGPPPAGLPPAGLPPAGPAGVPAGGQAGQAGGQAGPAREQAVVAGEIIQNVTGLDGIAKALVALGENFPIKQVLAEFFTKAANSNSPDDWKNAASDAANDLQNPPSDTVPPGGA